MKQRTLQFTRRFAAGAALLCSMLIIAQALLFNHTLKENSLALQSAALEAQNRLMEDTAALITEKASLREPANTREAVRLLRQAALPCGDVLYLILFAPTNDDRYFKARGAAAVNSSLDIRIDAKQPVRPLSESGLPQGSLASPAADPEIYGRDGYLLQNVYAPMKINGRSYSVLFMFSGEPAAKIRDTFNKTAHRSSIIAAASGAALILGILLLTLAFCRSHSLLMRRLARSMADTAQGKQGIRMSPVGDRDLDGLAASFNALADAMDGLKGACGGESKQAALEKALFEHGVRLIKENRPEEAAGIFGFLRSRNAASFGACFNLGVALAKSGKYAEALESFGQAQAVGPAYERTAEYIRRLENIIKAHGN